MGLSRRKYAALLLVQLSCIFGVNAVPAPQVTAPPASGPLNPSACASVASITNSLLRVSPQATPTVPATLAIECLQTVPNKVEPAQRLIKSLKAFLGWQSTLAFLKDPPQSYMFPPVDIMGGFDNISATVASGGFTNEFDFGLAIVYLIQAGHDGHFAFRPDVFRGFGFRNRMAMDIVSVSVDGIQVPKLYHFSELNATTSRNGAFPRAIVRINGEDAATVIERRNQVFSLYQDADSQWNSVMRSYAFPGASTFVAASLDYQGPNLTLTYDNGETRTEANFAIIRDGANFTGVNTGEDYYQRFCNPDTAPQAATATSTILIPAPTPTQTAAAAPSISGYPFPVIRDSGSNTTSGYFLNGTGYEDVAVLAVTSFSPGGDMGFLAYMTDFQRVVEQFLALCKANNKKKLVIDLAANGGGYIVAGYELFNQIFPGIPLFRADNLRETESLRHMAEVSGDFLTDILNFDGSGTNDGDADADTVARNRAFQALQQSPIIGNIVPGGVYAPDGTNLTTVDAILDPVIIKGDRFTAYAYTPLNETSSSFNISGTGHRANLPPAVFAPEDVVLLTDGTCGSTCTLFAYLMIQQLDVKATVVGGRPQTGPMQSVAGVEGAQVFFLPSLQSAASAVLTLSPDLNVTDSELAILDEGYALRRAASPANPGGVNGKNAFMKADAETPLQFLYQAANCRFFYTKEMLFGPGEVWKRAVDATWTDPEAFCVEGSRVETNLSVAQADGKFFLNSKIQADGAETVRGAMRALVVGVVVVVGMIFV
ncbi:peptidase S41 family protein [Immersiella caudata]|uniref:Peptidase S41 family protein n=1 Tax=Immersiella caudata TaxID=314043 RepID=A0AA39WSC6_9PEZI|nr:peptidase S41 family protein [Immersiella caudata]